ncbi:MAG: hypothetical protein JRH10_14770 [Deltaproteobacteria bacterium]|nr:hypothetical protein [Deltaproteobacteria bacterium]
MSSVSQELLDILVCPETRKPVALADGGTISSLNEKIRAGSASQSRRGSGGEGTLGRVASRGWEGFVSDR